MQGETTSENKCAILIKAELHFHNDPVNSTAGILQLVLFTKARSSINWNWLESFD